MFRLTVNALVRLGAEAKNPHLNSLRPLASFVWAKLVKLSGIYPDLSACAGCGKPLISGEIRMDSALEHPYHLSCVKLTAKGEPAGYKASAEALGAIYRMYDAPLAKLDLSGAPELVASEVERLLYFVLQKMMDKELKSRRFLEEALGW